MKLQLLASLAKHKDWKWEMATAIVTQITQTSYSVSFLALHALEGGFFIS